MSSDYDISRYVLQLYPPLIMMAAAGSVFICSIFRREWLRRTAIGVMILFWLLIPWFFKMEITEKTRVQHSCVDILELETLVPVGKPIFVPRKTSALFVTLKYDCGREVYPLDTFREVKARRLIETRGGLCLLRADGTGRSELPAWIRQYRLKEVIKKDAGNPFDSRPYFVYEILPGT